LPLLQIIFYANASPALVRIAARVALDLFALVRTAVNAPVVHEVLVAFAQGVSTIGHYLDTEQVTIAVTRDHSWSLLFNN
jgi:hypothetical protein